MSLGFHGGSEQPEDRLFEAEEKIKVRRVWKSNEIDEIRYGLSCLCKFQSGFIGIKKKNDVQSKSR